MLRQSAGRFRLFLSLSATLGFASAAHAAKNIPVLNPSFELPGDNANFTHGPEGAYLKFNCDDWNGSGIFAVFAPNTRPYPNGIPDAKQVGVVGDETGSGALFQDVPATVQIGQTYMLSVAVGNRADYSGSGLVNLETTGGAILASSGTVTPALGAFQQVTLNYTVTENDPFVGQGLRIYLTRSGGNQTNFDNVKLTSVPAPGALLVSVLGLVPGAVAFRRRRT